MQSTTEYRNRNAKLKSRLVEMKKVLERCLDDDYPGDLDKALIEAAYEDYLKLLCGND